MSKPTNQTTLDSVRRLYDDGGTMAAIAAELKCSPAWVRKLLVRTGMTRPRGWNFKKVETANEAQAAALEQQSHD